MAKFSLRKTVAAALATVALCAGASPACISLPADTEKPTLQTHVADWRNEVIYQLMVDRFANGDYQNDYRINLSAEARYHGGDWRGVIDKLGYLQSLGVTALWISPVVKNVETDAGVDGYHGYWAQNLTQTNPHFGQMGDLRALVRAAHSRGIKVIVDIVTNHMGQLFYYDINRNGQPDIQIAETGNRPDGNGGTIGVEHITEYDPDFDPRGVQSFTSLGEAGPAPVIFLKDPEANKMPAQPAIFQQPWAYHRMGRVYNFEEKFTDPNTGVTTWPQTELGDFPGGLKDIATELPQVREAMIDVYARWVEETDIDGFRIDTIKHVEHGFWQVFAPALRQRLAAQGKTNFLLFGESFDGDDARNGTYTKNNELDSVFYFSQKYQVFSEIFGRKSVDDPKGAQAPTSKVASLFGNRETNYGTTAHPQGIGIPPHKALVNFIDNHDVARFLYDRPDPKALRAALLFLFAEDGIPCLYYGTEQDFNGGNDPANREDLWSSGYATGGETFRWIQRLIQLRKSYRALSHGDLSIRWVTDHTGAEQDAGMLAFERADGDAQGGYALVVINTHSEKSSKTSFEQTVMQTRLPPNTPLVDVLTGQEYAVDESAQLDVEATPLTGMILIPKDQVRTTP